MEQSETHGNDKPSPSERKGIGMEDVVWYVMRDLTRFRRGKSAYAILKGKSFKVYTPVKLVLCKGGMEERPILQDLLIVNSSRNKIDAVLPKIPKLQYRYKKGAQKDLMVVSDGDMELFIKATGNATSVDYLRPDQVTPAMIGKTITVASGPLKGHEVTLAKIRGARRKRIIVQLPGLIAARVEIDLGEMQA